MVSAVAACAEARAVLARAGGLLRGRDLAGAAATLTYFSAIALVPWLLLALWSTTWWHGAARAEARLLDLRVLVPPDMGGRPSWDVLARAATHLVDDLGWAGVVVLLLPASFYGEGLRRAGLALVPQPDRFTGWRARVTVMALLVVVLPLTWVLLALADLLVPWSPEGGGGGAGDLWLRIVVGFTSTWLALSVVLGWVFAVVMPGRPRTWVAAVGALATASFLAGFLQGFQLFLAIPIDVGLPFGGLGFVGGVVAVGLWLYVLHTLLLTGWVLTRAADDRAAARRSPDGPPPTPAASAAGVTP